MYKNLFYLAVVAAAASAFLSIWRLFRGGSVSYASEKSNEPATQEFSRLLRKTLWISLVFFLAGLAIAYYLDFVRHNISDMRIAAASATAYILFLVLLLLTYRFYLYMEFRIRTGEKNSLSKLFRYLLYAGALLGIVSSLLNLGYIAFTEKFRMYSSEFYLLPAYVAGLTVFWLRFQVALIARSSDYAFELLARQEAIVPLIGAANPLWKMRQGFAAMNRFLFGHLEFLIICVVVLLVTGNIETQMRLVLAGHQSMSLTVFALGVISGIPGFLIMRVRDKSSPETFLWNIRTGYIVAISILAILSYMVFIIFGQMHIKYFWIILIGAITALLLNVYSAIYVAENHRIARSFIAAAATSVSTVIHKGIAAGMRGAAIPALIMTMMMGLAYLLGVIGERGEDRFSHGLFGLALALTAMVSLFPVAQATVIMMPLASTAIGRLRLGANTESKTALMEKFRNLRSVSVPSYVLQGQLMFSALVVLVFLVYAQVLGDAGNATLFRHLTQTAMLLLGGIASYFLSARVNELVLNLGPMLVRETSRQFRDLSGLTAGTANPDMRRLTQLANSYLVRKTLPLFIGAMILPAVACLLGGEHGLAGYLIGFGFFSFMGGSSWSTTGAAWSSARHAAEADNQVVRHSAQIAALTEADIVGDSMHEAAAPALSIALLTTIIASLLFAPATLELHAQLRLFFKAL